MIDSMVKVVTGMTKNTSEASVRIFNAKQSKKKKR